jgi:hypothetical protein
VAVIVAHGPMRREPGLGHCWLMDAVVQLSDLTKPSTTGGAPAVDRASQVVAAAGAVAVKAPSDSGKPGYSGLVG